MDLTEKQIGAIKKVGYRNTIKYKAWSYKQERMIGWPEVKKHWPDYVQSHNEGDDNIRLLEFTGYRTGVHGDGKEVYEADIVKFSVSEGMIGEAGVFEDRGPHWGIIIRTDTGLNLETTCIKGQYPFHKQIKLGPATWLRLESVEGNIIESPELYNR